MDPSLLNHYEAELAFVRETGGEFAREFPKIAARLNLGSFDVADPYVERLFEGFALLAARIQLKLEAEFPTFTQSLLQMVYPHYLAPTPAMAVVQFRPEASLRGVPQGVTLPPGTELRSLLGTEDQTNCEFRTAHPVQLLPIELAEAEYIASPAALTALGLPEQPGVKAAIRLRLRATGEAPFARLALERLPLFLAGPEGARARLYEQLVANLTAVYVRPAQRPLPWQERLPAAAVRPLGFEPEEALLPRTPASFEGYRLLQEYFAMPERFLFVELGRLDRAVSRCAGQELEIVLLLNRSEPVLAASFGPDHLGLFCTPAINLFPRRADRINLNGREAEYHVVPDRVRPLDFEVFGVTAVEGYAADGSAPQPFLPFYAANDLSPHAGAPGLLHAAPRAAAALRTRPAARAALQLSRPRGVHLAGRSGAGAGEPFAAPTRARPAVHQSRSAAVDAGRQAAHRSDHRGQRAGGLGPLPGRPDRAAPLPQRRRVCLALHQPSGAQLSEPGRYRRAARAHRRCARCCGSMCHRRLRSRRGNWRG